MSEATTGVQWRFRLLTCCIALTSIAFIQSPGRIVADTKVDLVLDPGGFLHRAMTLWDPHSSFGQVQNQAYGYFFPMGPFFWLGNLVHLDPWVTQRLWWSLLFVVAFLGIVKLAGELGVRSDGARLLAAAAFALSPRILSVVGPSSIEVWPSALAPWVLIPLVIATKRGNPLKGAALSALAVTCIGGVNAAATFAVLPLGVLWILFAEPGPRRRRLMLWWPPLVVLATLWWLIPLFLLASYSPPFLDYIESSSITTVAASAFDALRGTTNWVPYISLDSQAGHQLITQQVLILNGAVVLGLGLTGLAMRSTPHRRFLFSGLMLGLVFVTAGHTGSIHGFGAGTVQELLDGVLAPLRNTHKFDVVLRIPLVIGLAHAVSALTHRASAADRGENAVRAIGVGFLAVAAVAGAVAPAWSGQLANKGSFTAVPDYWSQASTWLSVNATGTSLLAPASAFPDYLWGSTGDEPIQSLSTTPWAVRNSIPLANGGTIRYLDSITAQLDKGRGSSGLASTLRRAGVEYLVVRNDLDPTVAGGNIEQTYRTIEDSDGLTGVASFGPELGGDPVFDSGDRRSFANGGWQSRHPAIEIFKVQNSASTTTQDGVATVVGNSDSLTLLDDLGITDGRSVVTAPDQPVTGVPESVVLTDGNRRQEVAFGSVHANRSNSLALENEYSSKRRVHDYLDSHSTAASSWLAVPELRGARSLQASGSRADVGTVGGTRPSDQPWSAFDGDPRTSWTTTDAEPWIRLTLDHSENLGSITITVDQPPGAEQHLTVLTGTGPQKVVAAGTTPVTVDLGTVDAVEVRGSDPGLSISDISSPSLQVSRPLVLPKLPADWPAPHDIVLGDDGVDRPGCLPISGLDRCRASQTAHGEDGFGMDRIFTMPAGSDYRASLTVQPVGGPALEAYLQDGDKAQVSASSTVNDDPRAGVSRAMDHDLKTGWISRPGDTDPFVTLQWKKPQKLSEIHLSTAESLPASAPREVVLEFGQGIQRRATLVDGVARFATVTSDRVDVHLTTSTPSLTFSPSGIGERLPVGISELWFGPAGKSQVATSDGPITVPCGLGPMVTVNGTTYDTSVETSTAAMAAGRSARSTLCDATELNLPQGTQRIRVAASPMFRATSLALTRTAGDPGAGSAPTVLTRTDSSSVDRTIALPADAQTSVLTTGENFNTGWVARLDGVKLAPLQVDGWQQAWTVPAHGAGTLVLRYEPDTVYRAGLLAGAAGAALVLFLALWRRKDFVTTGVGHGKRRTTAVATALGTVVAFGMVGGVPFLLALAVGAAGAWLLERRSVDPTWLPVAPLAVAAVFYVVRPWGTSSAWAGTLAVPQICVALTLGVLAFTVLSDRQDLSRRNGSSTKR